ncbi:MAG TPA: hypothetical protein VFL97_01705 [Nitrococcus sp.]|nr:hypothetical protein [Nitrococcus sp.]
MGKASRGKRRTITRDDAQGLHLAAAMILDPRLSETFQSIKLHERLESFQHDEPVETLPMLAPPTEPPEPGAQESQSGGFVGRLRQQTPASWASGLHTALRSRPLRERLSTSIEAGRQALRKASDFGPYADRFGLDAAARAQAERAYSDTRARLLAEPAAPAWLALVVICLARTIATNAHERFAAEAWDELTLFMYGLEREFLLAAGDALVAKLIEFDHVFYEDRLAEVIGSRLPFGLAELACNMADTGLFDPARES